MLERGSGMSGESPRAGGVAHSASRFSPVTMAGREGADVGRMAGHPRRHTKRMSPEQAELGTPGNE